MIDKNVLTEFCQISKNYYYRNPINKEKILNGGNEMRNSEKLGSYKIIGFADKHMKRMINMFFKKKIKKYKIIDSVQIFKLSDIDKGFKEKHRDLFSDKRIFPWIAKAYLIKKVLNESDYGDTILWIDSDIRDISENGIQNIFNLCNNSEYGLVAFIVTFGLKEHSRKLI